MPKGKRDKRPPSDTSGHRAFVDAFIAPRHKPHDLFKGFIPSDDVCHRLATTTDQRWMVSLVRASSLTENVIALIERLGVIAVEELLPRISDEGGVTTWVTPLDELRDGAFNVSGELYRLHPGDLAYYVSEAMPGHCDRWLLIRDNNLRRRAVGLIDG